MKAAYIAEIGELRIGNDVNMLILYIHFKLWLLILDIHFKLWLVTRNRRFSASLQSMLHYEAMKNESRQLTFVACQRNNV